MAQPPCIEYPSAWHSVMKRGLARQAIGTDDTHRRLILVIRSSMSYHTGKKPWMCTVPIVTLSSKSQIVLPHDIRQSLGLQKGDRLRITLEGERLVLPPLPPLRGRNWQGWRGCLSGTQALQEHLAEHADEVDHERLP
jgi:AbrB family looped-hinge helix DNA binding protein